MFSQGVDNLLNQIRPYGQPDSLFPAGYLPVEGRKTSAESTHEWFRRLVDSQCGGDAKRCAIEDNIAIFLKLIWKDGERLHYANIQTLVAPCDLEDYYLTTPPPSAIYLRLDLDYDTLGSPFSHPLPHVHFASDVWPRFALDGGNAGNVVVDYLEFIYRHCVPTSWRNWAERVWKRKFVHSDDDELDNPFTLLMTAFDENQFGVLKENREMVARIKTALRERKDEYFPYFMSREDREILEYPSAR